MNFLKTTTFGNYDISACCYESMLSRQVFPSFTFHAFNVQYFVLSYFYTYRTTFMKRKISFVFSPDRTPWKVLEVLHYREWPNGIQ